MDVSLGTLVEVQNGRGVVRFSGTTSFSGGKWVGVELADPKGKNDGTVGGISYFHCKPNYGVFVRPSQVKILEGGQPAAVSPPTLAQRPMPIAAPRPTFGHQRTLSSGLAVGGTFRSSTSFSNSSRSSSPVKGSTIPATTPAKMRLGQPSPTKRTSMSVQPLRKASLIRQSPATESTTLPALGFSVRRSDSPSQEVPPSPVTPFTGGRRVPSGGPPPTLIHSRTASQTLMPPPPVPHILAAQSTESASSEPASPCLEQPQQARPQDEQEIQELKAKVRVLEVKRADDARHVRELETRLSEAETFVALRPKLQAKLNQQQTDLIATRRELADSLQLAQMSESRLADSQEQLEMAMLDKEVAEEKAELLESEIEEVKEKLAVAEVELKVLQEGGEVGDGESGDKSSLAYIQLEKQNERLKEALIKLRDISQETESEQRRRISEMEKDIVGVDDLQSQLESALVKLTNADVQIEDLKLQLDDALGAEEMLVQLTERNLMLGEKIEEMRITIEDLEALKELSDELEENHVEVEKALHEEIESKNTQSRDQLRKIESLEEACLDLEGTISQFRELVMQLQTDLDNLRTQTQTAQTESATAASQTAAMMSLNIKLQSSAVKNQAKTIELELKKIEVKETKELLSIIQPYLPQVYVDSDSDATSCYLFFQRLAYKTDLINNVVAQVHGLPESLNGAVPDILVGVCEMRGRISGLSTLCKRFAAILRRCDADSFLNIGRIYQEIAPMEKRIDLHIDLLRRDEFREMECVSDIVKMQSQFEHIAETYFGGFELDLGERELGYALAFEHDLDVFAASVGLTKTSVSALIQDPDAELDMGGLDIETELLRPLQNLLEQCKTAKSLSRKLTKRLDELLQDSSSLKSHLLDKLKDLSNLVPELVNFGISLAQLVLPHISDVRSSKCSFQLTTVMSFVKQTAMSTVAKDLKPGASAWEAVGAYISRIIQESGKVLPSVMEAVSVMKVTGTAPWVTRVGEIKASLAVNVEAERKVAQLNDEMQALVRTLKTRDQNIQESEVKIELMERRVESAKKQADAIADLESKLSLAKKQEKAFEDAMEQLQADLDTLEQDNAKLKTMTVNQERQAAAGPQPAETENVPIEGSLETSYLLEQIDALRGTVRFLRNENQFLKGQDLLREIKALPPLYDPVVRTPTPPLDPSGLSDTDDSSLDEFHALRPTLHSVTTEAKVLYRDVIKFSSSPRVVDLSEINAKRAQAKIGKVWLPKKKTPAHQVQERKLEAERLSRRVKSLMERANMIEA